ncbi:MAG TPA: DUF1707 domain-containing protein [Streptosporangiaceae bacterium]
MSQGSRPYPGDNYRASDADRDAVLTQLSEHFQAGRLTHTEFDERSDQALQAKTYGDLTALMSDLPGSSLMPPHQVPAHPIDPGQSAQAGRPAIAPAIVAVVTVVLGLGLLLGSAQGHHGSGLLWLIIVIPLLLRRIFARGRGGSRRW